MSPSSAWRSTNSQRNRIAWGHISVKCSSIPSARPDEPPERKGARGSEVPHAGAPHALLGEPPLSEKSKEKEPCGVKREEKNVLWAMGEIMTRVANGGRVQMGHGREDEL